MQASIRVRIVSLAWALAILLLVFAWIIHTIRAERVRALNDVNNGATEVHQAISRAKVELERYLASVRASETPAQVATQEHVRAAYEEILRSHAKMHMLFLTISANGADQEFVKACQARNASAQGPPAEERVPRSSQ